MRVVVHTASKLGRLVGALLALAALGVLLVGVPWGLWTYIGWPLPGHVPSRDEVEALLLHPMSVWLLLDVLACIAWPTWLAFVVDVARCVPDVLRGTRPPTAGPLQAVAGFLLVAILLGAPGTRVTTPAASALTERVPAPITATTSEHPPEKLSGPAPQQDTVTVRQPQNGVHDSLWRIAQRELGDGTRWRELFTTNYGLTQADGESLTDPNIIRPGWVLLIPGHTASRPVTPEPSKHPTPPTVSEEAPQPPSVPRETPEPAPHEEQQSSHAVGIAVVTGGFLSAALASAVAVALWARHRRRLRGYRTPRGSEPSLAPVVRALRIADDQRQFDLDEVEESEPTVSVPEETPEASVDIGVRDGQACAINLAAVHGLGIIGTGAEATVRALLVHLLGTTTTTVVMPEPDAVALLGTDLPDSPRLRTAPDLDTALADLSALSEHPSPDGNPVVTVIATADPAHSGLRSLLDHGSERGIAGIVLGSWPAGATIRVRSDGTVAAASPSVNSALGGARLFHVDAADTRDLIDLFTQSATPRESTHGEPDTAEEEVPPLPEVEVEHVDQSEAEPPPEQLDEVSESATVANRSDSSHALTLNVFGQVTLSCRTNGVGDLTSRLTPKHKALLVLLALHPGGTTREVVREALWPDAGGRRPFNSFYATLSQIRKVLTNATEGLTVDLIDQHGDHVALNAGLVDVDYWNLREAERDRTTATTDEQRVEACSRIVAAYRGELADGLTSLWLDGPREAAHRSVVDALATMAAYYRDIDSERHLQFLEHARLLNPENEDIYRDIMRVQAELGRIDAISRTLQLLTTALAEIGTRPDTSTLTLARALQEREHQRTATG